MSEAHAAGHHAKGHDYHLVDPSPWPFVGSIAGLLLVVGLVMFMHDYASGPYVLAGGIFMVLFTMYRWWRDVVREATYEGAHTAPVRVGHRLGMALFIASEVMFFAAFFWAFFNASMFPTDAIGNAWPPEGIETFDPWHLPLVNTLILLLSGTTVTWAHHAMREGDNSTTVRMLTITVLLGLTFSFVQGYEYIHAHFGFTDGIYASTFYMATGFHGAHVIIGTLFLLVCLFRAKAGHFKPEHHVGFESAAWYWHFVDVVWLFLFVWVYLWGGS